MPIETGAQARRPVYCVLSARSLPYATPAFRSLLANCDDELRLTLITDGADDKRALVDAMSVLAPDGRHAWTVRDKAEADERAAIRLARHPNVAAFREGHPCWRKITDPLLFAEDGEEMVLLDPDLYFPNRFRFEPTPERGLLLMYQPPSCLLPHETVVSAFDLGVPMAHHTDIGVAQIRAPLDLDWLDGLLGSLGGRDLPRSMHVESIVWAAMAMRVGGGYLDAEHWHCWRNSHWKRMVLKLGASGHDVLRAESFRTMKCFHGGGAAKWWIPDAVEKGIVGNPEKVEAHRDPRPYVELSRGTYDSLRRWKEVARRLGYHALMKT